MFLSKLSLAWLYQYAIWAMNIIIMIAEYMCVVMQIHQPSYDG